jgi:hydroxymethylglutaryl-CoA reductase (NADPH)
MPRSQSEVTDYLTGLLKEEDLGAIAKRLRPRSGDLPPRVPGASLTSTESIERRWRLLAAKPDAKTALWDGRDADGFASNIENYIGAVYIPIGLIGPLRINGLFAGGDFYVPLATTEAALVASYHRGALAISESGGCSAMLLSEGVARAPGFIFADVIEAGTFAAWAVAHLDDFRREAGATTRHGQLRDMQITIEGNHVYLTFEYTTGDAAGQNMVTIATQAICDWIIAQSPVKPARHFVEANLSGDKKASALSFVSVRGRKVTAEVRLPKSVIEKRLRTDATAMEDYWRMSALGGVMSGTIGVQGHYANGLAALYIATGQDAACVSESSVGVTRFERVGDGDLYAAVTLPNLVVGTVGGGTGLPTQRACLEILGVAGDHGARALAEICAAVSLAGELSIIAALSAGHFASAHKKLARG